MPNQRSVRRLLAVVGRTVQEINALVADDGWETGS
jgi:hypothetical protein